ncbi:MAG TPA: dephospho-CoA kinase [Kineosporiaceae bacterium]|nr:dephospho-CoA kinase [Kineosporiaceae bacterium]
MLMVGLTGGIGAGKSTVAGRLRELGATIIDADQLAREVVEPGTPGLAEVVAAFGAQVLLPDGRLDRPALGRIVFGDAEKLARLNAILHPLIGERTRALIESAPPDAVLVHDIPLLVENGLADGFQLVIVVHAPESERIRRLIEDRGMTETEAVSRIRAQAADEERRTVADVWIDNSGTRAATVTQVDDCWRDRIEPLRTT